MSSDAGAKQLDLAKIVPFFQPIYNLSTNTVTRYECLARMVDDAHHLHLPHDFLHLVERDKITSELTHRMLELSTAFFASKKMRWSINMFADDLSDSSVQQKMSEICQNAIQGLCGIEMPYHTVKQALTELRAFRREFPNLHITIDDVDECTESLHSLIASGIDAVKLRGGLVKEISSSYGARKTIACVQRYCEKYDVDLIAEHIEDKETFNAVNSLDISFGQGFYLSKPLKAV